MATVVGIDLGTTNSLIGAVVDGRPELIGDERGDVLLPSVVGAGPDGRLVVGRAARNRRLVDPERTAASIKRQMGQPATVRVGDRSLSPPQVSALILGALIDRVETRLGERPQQAVITVPAFFDDLQRQATREAGLIAGLEVLRLVNEPTAGAMHYQSGAEANVLVYDLGGGTFDVSVLESDEGFLEVRASHGDTKLGGDDLDRALLAHVLGRIGPDAARTVESDPQGRTRLLDAVERAKIALADRDEVTLHEPFLAGSGAQAVNLELRLTLAELEQVCRPFVARTLDCVDRALRDSRIRPDQLDRVVLVGGSSKMPLVAQTIREHLKRPVLVDGDADRAVALGATRLAARSAGHELDEVLVDITPHTLSAGVLKTSGFGMPDEFAAPIIARSSVIPARVSRTFYTGCEDQERVEVPVLQGESREPDECTSLGVVTIGDLPPSPDGSPVTATFALDLSGVLHVSATHEPSGKTASVTIADAPTRLTGQQRRRAREQVESMRQQASAPRQGDAVELPAPLDEAGLKLARAMAMRARRVLDDAEPELPDELRERVREAHDALVEAIEHRHADVDERCNELSDTLLELL